MSRWEPNARERLERAAIELFVDQGFAETTVPQITARAGLTTRTFFRHFADKREVLFAYQEELPALVARVMADAPAALTPMEVIAQGLETIATTRFEGLLDYLRTRNRVVQADPGLRERDLRKQAVLSEAITQGFQDRGLDELTSTLAAHLAVTVLSVALGRWLEQDGGQDGSQVRDPGADPARAENTLADLVRDTLGALRSVTADPIDATYR